jgi:hypothetical protein
MSSLRSSPSLDQLRWRTLGASRWLAAELWLHGRGLVRRFTDVLPRALPRRHERAPRNAPPLPSFVARALKDYGLKRTEVSVAVAAYAYELPASQRLVELPDPELEVDRCEEFHASTGFWPVTFSHPSITSPGLSTTKTQAVSTVVPGFPYQYRSESLYHGQYERSQFAITFKKGGWDCFRHVEIIAAGAVPVMLGADRIPRFTMMRYPKRWMSAVVKEFVGRGPFDTTDAAQQLREFAALHLSTRATARYLLDTAGATSDDQVLFLDPDLSRRVDYLSAQVLLGLKQLLGPRCIVPFPVDYLYDSFPEDATQRLYGRGFGYARRLDDALRHPSETLPSAPDPAPNISELVRRHRPTVIVVGSLRSEEVRSWLAERRTASDVKIVALHGEDSPPTASEQRLLRKSDFAFVREYF